MTKVLEAALHYARNGLPVFPLVPGGKEPIIKDGHGFLDATTDAATIEAWWAKWPDANVAIATGAGRLVVVDIDPRNGGDATWSKVALEHDPLELTPTVTTGSGGTHIYLKAPFGVRSSCTRMSRRSGVGWGTAMWWWGSRRDRLQP